MPKTASARITGWEWIRQKIKISTKGPDPTSGRFEEIAFRRRDIKRGKFLFLSIWHLLGRHAKNQTERHQRRTPIESIISTCFRTGTKRWWETMFRSWTILQEGSWNIDSTRRNHLQGRWIFHITEIQKTSYGRQPKDAFRKTGNRNGFANCCLVAWHVTRRGPTSLKIWELSKEQTIARKNSLQMARSRRVGMNSHEMGPHERQGNILVVVNASSGLIKAFPTNDSDNGPEFISDDFKTWCKFHWIHEIQSPI